MNEIIIDSIKIVDHKITYGYTIHGEWKKYFNKDQIFEVIFDQNVENTTYSIAVLPLLGNVLILAALLDGTIYVDEVDQDFFDCVTDVIKGYQTMSPRLNFKTEQLIVANKVVRNTLTPEAKDSVLFFSGGVDAWSSFITHMEERPTLISVWGADIEYDNCSGWKSVLEQNQKIATESNVKLHTIHSNLRSFLNEKQLNHYSNELVNDNWWSAFQHSVGMMCLAAPLIGSNITALYFASSYSSKDEKREYIIASDPMIDNHVKFCGCHVVHDGYEFSRHDKVRRICEFSKEKKISIPLRVCFSERSGENCGRCEKCANTIMSILIEGQDPESFGLSYDKDNISRYFASGMQEMAREEEYAFISLYKDIQIQYRRHYKRECVPKELLAFYDLDVEELAAFLHVPCQKCQKREAILEFYETEILGKHWLEEQRNVDLLKIRELEQVCESKDAWIHELEEAKDWLEGQNKILNGQIPQLHPPKNIILKILKQKYKK